MKTSGIYLNESKVYRNYAWVMFGVLFILTVVIAHAIYFVYVYTNGALYTKIAYAMALAMNFWAHCIYNGFINIFYLNLYLKFNALNEFFR